MHACGTEHDLSCSAQTQVTWLPHDNLNTLGESVLTDCVCYSKVMKQKPEGMQKGWQKAETAGIDMTNLVSVNLHAIEPCLLQLITVLEPVTWLVEDKVSKGPCG